MSVVGNSTLIPTTPPPTTTATSAGETVAVIVPPRLPIDVITRPDRTRPRKRPARSPIKTPERIPFVRVHPGMTVQQRREAEAHNAAAAANRVERGKIKNNKAAKRSRARKDAQLDLQFREIAQLRWECQWWKDRAIARGEKEVRFDWSVHEKECDEELRRLDEEALRRLPLAKGGAKREEAAAPTTPDVDADGEDEE